MRSLMVVALVVAGVAPAFAQPGGVQQYLGKSITDVRVEVSGVAMSDPALLELVETRVAEPLSMRNVRSTIDHLVGLGRFEDVRVFAAATDQGVQLGWRLIPVKRITKVTVTGPSVLSES